MKKLIVFAAITLILVQTSTLFAVTNKKTILTCSCCGGGGNDKDK